MTNLGFSSLHFRGGGASIGIMQEPPLQESCLAAEVALLERIMLLDEEAMREVKAFIGDQELVALSSEYAANLKRRRVEIGFNLFELISDVYYRENLHSDILRALLDPEGKHQMGGKYLRLFLEFLRSQGAAVDVSQYEQAQVEREKGRIDVRILDQKSKRAIIVENKINDADDQPRQLPGYLEQVRNLGYNCDAIIYLRLNGLTRPDTSDWTDEDHKLVQPLLTVICAYDDSDRDLLSGWIRKCESASVGNPDAQHVLRQYGDLIKKLGGNVMNKPIMEKFFNIMVTGENLKTALSLRGMLDDLILYRVERIIEKFRNDLAPFNTIKNYLNCDAYFFGLHWQKAHLGIDIGVEPESYAFQFWDREDRGGANGHAKAILEQMGCLTEYSVLEGGMFTRVFPFPSQDQELLDHITAFKRRLREIVTPAQSEA